MRTFKMKNIKISTGAEMKAVINGFYGIQKLRIQTGNRYTVNIKTKLGLKPGMKEAEMEKIAKKYLEDVRKHFKLITDGLLTIPPPSKFVPDKIFDNYTEMQLAGMYSRLAADEDHLAVRLEPIIEATPLWQQYLCDVKGVGPIIAGCILTALDPYKAKYPSSFHKYCGLDVADDGKARSKREEHLIKKEYVDKEGNIKKKKSITYNPWIRTKLIGVLGPSFLKQPDSPYRAIYDNYKHRLENDAKYKNETKGHRNAMAIRYMIKMFIIDLHMAWRKIEGLPVSEPYHIAKLHYNHGNDVTNQKTL